MNPRIGIQVKIILSKLFPDSTWLRYLSYLPRLERFRKTYPEKCPIFKKRWQLYDYINDVVIKNEPIVYCEFGVFEGASFEYWTNINSDTNSIFYGFDTFSGLPESWESNPIQVLDKGTFDTGGKCPQINDKRASFIKGMFQDTLPEFLENYSSTNPLVIHNDADLYSSTLYVLTAANHIIVPGTIIIFDEFSSMLNEFRALDDYCSSYLRKYDIVAATTSSVAYFSQVAIRMK